MLNTPKLRSWLLGAGLLWMAIGNGVVLWKSRVPILQGYGDFSAFYTAGVLVRRGLGSELYDRTAQWKVQREFAPEVRIRRGPLPYIRPPFEALLFSVFASWPYATALLVWTTLKLVLLIAIPFVVVHGKSWKQSFPRWTAGLLSVGTFPVFIDFFSGQDAVLLAFLFAVSFWLLAIGRDRDAGLTLGLALFKFQLVIPFVVILLIAGRKRLLSGFAMSTFIVLAISVGIVGWKGLLQYPRYLLALNQATGVGVVTAEYQMNLRGLLTFFVGRSPYPGRIHWVLLPIAIGAIAYAGFLWRKAGDGFLAVGFGLALIVAIVTSYYAYGYDLLLLIVPLLAMSSQTGLAEADKFTRYAETSGWLLLLLTPAYWFARTQFKAECLMTLPLLAVGIALARRLSRASLQVCSEQGAPALDGVE